MKLTAIVENTIFLSDMMSEHGLSLLLDTGDEKILLDTGRSGLLLKNMRALGISTKDIAYCVLSHGHNDHTGGLPCLLAERPELPIVFSEDIFFTKLKKTKEIGMPAVEFSNRIVINNDNPVVELSKNVFVFKCSSVFDRSDTAWSDFYVRKHGGLQQDTFDDEVALAVHHGDAVSVISGCSHNGPTNIMETARKFFNVPVRFFAGGLHTKGEKNADRLQNIVSYVHENGITGIAACHCTGIDAYAYFHQHCTCSVQYLSTGQTVEL